MEAEENFPMSCALGAPIHKLQASSASSSVRQPLQSGGDDVSLHGAPYLILRGAVQGEFLTVQAFNSS